MGRLWIEDSQLSLDSGGKTKAFAPAIISASRVTDIPAHYCDWFFERLRRGYLASPAVNSVRKMHRFVSLANTQFIVFFSKNPRPLIPYLPRLKEKDIDFYINFTLNDYTRLSFESGLNVEEPLNMRIDTFKRLAEAAGPERVIWHFDPLIIAPNIRIHNLMERISSIAEQLKGYTNRLSFGFLNVPKHSEVESNLKARKILYKPWTKAMRTAIVQEIAKANKSWGFELATCSCEDDFSKLGIQQGRCVDYQLITRLAWRNDYLMDTIGAKIYNYDPHPSLFGDVDPVPEGAIMLDSKHYILPSNQYKGPNGYNAGKNECRCDYSFDIGVQGTCTYKCAYCFAALPSYKLDSNVKAHKLNPSGSSLTGEKEEELHIPIEKKLQPKGIQLDRSLKALDSAPIEYEEIAKKDENDPYYILATRIYHYKEAITVKDIKFLKSLYPDPYEILKVSDPHLTLDRVNSHDKSEETDSVSVSDNENVVQILPEDSPFLEDEEEEDDRDEVALSQEIISRDKKEEGSSGEVSKELTENLEETDVQSSDSQSISITNQETRCVNLANAPQSSENNSKEDCSAEGKEKTKKKELPKTGEAKEIKSTGRVYASEDNKPKRGNTKAGSIQGGKNQTLETPEEIIIDPDEEVDQFLSQISIDSETSYSSKEEMEDVLYASSHYMARESTPMHFVVRSKPKDSGSTSTKSSKSPGVNGDSNHSRPSGSGTKGEKTTQLDSDSASTERQSNQTFNVLDFLQKLRECGRYKSEEEVLEAFVQKVNSLELGGKEGIFGGNVTIGNKHTNSQSGQRQGRTRADNKNVGSKDAPRKTTSEGGKTLASEGEQDSASAQEDSIYGFLNKKYSEPSDNYATSSDGSSTDYVTDFGQVQDEIEKTQVKIILDSTSKESEMPVNPEDNDNKVSGEVDDWEDSEEDFEDWEENNTNNDGKEDSFGGFIGIDRLSLRSMMKKK